MVVTCLQLNSGVRQQTDFSHAKLSAAYGILQHSAVRHRAVDPYVSGSVLFLGGIV
jgi:hypothetical protein